MVCQTEFSTKITNSEISATFSTLNHQLQFKAEKSSTLTMQKAANSMYAYNLHTGNMSDCNISISRTMLRLVGIVTS